MAIFYSGAGRKGATIIRLRVVKVNPLHAAVARARQVWGQSAQIVNAAELFSRQVQKWPRS
jgi:hypothetical protein